jgi:hypothetical protein
MQNVMRFKTIFKSYSKNQWLWCWEHSWFDKVNTVHTIMSKSEHCCEGIIIILKN